MSLLKSGLRNLLFMFSFGFLAGLAGYATRAFLARIISQEAFGLFYASVSLVIFLTVFTNFGMGTSTVKYLSEFLTSKHRGKISTVIILTAVMRTILCLIISGFMIINSKAISLYYFKTTTHFQIIILCAILLFFITITNIYKRIYHGFQQIFILGLSDFVQTLAFFVIVLITYYFGYLKVYTLLKAQIASFGIMFLFFILLSGRVKKYFAKPSHVKEISKKVAYFSAANLLSAFTYMIIGYLDTLVLTIYRPLNEVGIYNAVLPTVLIPTFIAKGIYNVFFPMVSGLHKTNNLTKISEGYQLIKRYLILILLPAVFMMIMFPEDILTVLFGKSYSAGSTAMVILAFGLIFHMISLVNNGILNGINRPFVISKGVMYSSILNVVLNVILIPQYGIEGAAIATLISYVFIYLYQKYHLRGVVVGGNLRSVFTYVLLSVFYAIALTLLKTYLHIKPTILDFALTVFLCVIIYVLLLALTGMLKLKEIKTFSKQLLNR